MKNIERHLRFSSCINPGQLPSGKAFARDDKILKKTIFPLTVAEIYYIVFPTKNLSHRFSY